IWGRAFNLDTPLTAGSFVNTELHDPQKHPDVAALPNGGYVVAYQSGQDESVPISSASQMFTELGAKAGSEVFSGGWIFEHYDIATFPDGSYAIAGIRDDSVVHADVHAANGSITDFASFGDTETNNSDQSAIVAVDASHYAVFWNGIREE